MKKIYLKVAKICKECKKKKKVFAEGKLDTCSDCYLKKTKHPNSAVKKTNNKQQKVLFEILKNNKIFINIDSPFGMQEFNTQDKIIIKPAFKGQGYVYGGGFSPK